MKILTIDVGNTSCTLGLVEGRNIISTEEVPTESLKSVDSGIFIDTITPQLKKAEGISFCSVVPDINTNLKTLLKKFSLPVFHLTHETCKGLPLSYPKPVEIGQDRLANAIAAQTFFSVPAIVIDMGTAVTFDIISSRGGYEGGIIAPGLSVITHYLHEQTALLPELKEEDLLSVEGAIGKSTVHAMKLGVAIGFSGMIDALLKRVLSEMKARNEPNPIVLSTGGSIANLLAVVTARDAHDLKSSDFSKTVVYLTEQTHHSIHKALRTAGLKECVLRYVPLDYRFRMETNALEKTIKADKKAGLNPWLIAAAAGTTDTGAVDPLEDIADIAAARRLWLHVDGAYGASFALCPQGKKKLKGVERSDSMIVNPHKGMFLPLGSGVILVREGKYLLQAHHSDASYLQDKDILASPDEVSPTDLSLELTRPFRGLRLWLPLKILGVAPFRAALSEKLLLAQYFYKKIQQVDRFEMGPFPDLSIVTFRYIPQRGDVNQFNQKLVNAIQKDGRIFISSTTLDGKFTLRLAVLGFRTHLDTIDQAIEILQEKVRTIAGG